MDLKVHREMLYYGAKRAASRLTGTGSIDLTDSQVFLLLWRGNWLTDMNQTTAFFDLCEQRKNPYDAFKNGKYQLPKFVEDPKYTGQWCSLFEALWTKECESIQYPEIHAAGCGFQALNKDIIGGYYPYDHFDVVDQVDSSGNLVSREDLEFNNKYDPLMTVTAYDGVYGHAYWGWLHGAFATRSSNPEWSLHCLGRGLHTLQDFFAHSNYVELLLLHASEVNVLDPDLARTLMAEYPGTFRSYCGYTASASSVHVMTGRFDRIDTVAVLLKIYKNGLVPYFRDLAASGHDAAPEAHETRDLLFDVMFGTFSNNPFARRTIKALRQVAAVNDAIECAKSVLVRGVMELFASIAKIFTNKEVDQSIDEVKNLIQTASTEKARDFATVGRIVYLEHVIEKQLREKVQQAKAKKILLLPHHTLLAKDNDVGQPESRLAYKLGCTLATAVTSDVLYHYAAGHSHADVEKTLQRYYRHPKEFLDEDGRAARLRQLTDDLYGKRWWRLADEEEGGRI